MPFNDTSVLNIDCSLNKLLPSNSLKTHAGIGSDTVIRVGFVLLPRVQCKFPPKNKFNSETEVISTL